MEANELELILEKSFHQLSEGEKLEMKDLFTNEEEFLQVKLMLSSISSTIFTEQEKTTVSPKIKQDLDGLFHQTYQNKGVLWYNSIGTFFISKEKHWYQQNLVRIAAILILMLSVIPFMKSDLNESTTQLAKLDEGKTNTEKSKTEAKEELKDKDVLSSNDSDSERLFESTEVLKEEMPMEKLAEVETSIDVSDDETFKASAPALSGGVFSTTHPDGIYVGDAKDKESNHNFALDSQVNILDLLTPTF